MEINKEALSDFLRCYKLFAEKMNEVLLSVSERVDLTEDEIKKLKEIAVHYNSMKYYAKKSEIKIIQP